MTEDEFASAMRELEIKRKMLDDAEYFGNYPDPAGPEEKSPLLGLVLILMMFALTASIMYFLAVLAGIA